MSVSVERTTATAATVVWETADDPQDYIAQAIDSGHLEAALAALGHERYSDLAALSSDQRAELLRATARLAAELTRRTRHLTVAVHDIDGASWADLAVLLADDPAARSSARSTYSAGLRQMGRAQTDPSRWRGRPIIEFTDTELAAAIERYGDESDPVTRDLVRSCVRELGRRKGLPAE